MLGARCPAGGPQVLPKRRCADGALEGHRPPYRLPFLFLALAPCSQDSSSVTFGALFCTNSRSLPERRLAGARAGASAAETAPRGRACAQGRVLGERLQGVFGGREGVHQHELHLRRGSPRRGGVWCLVCGGPSGRPWHEVPRGER